MSRQSRNYLIVGAVLVVGILCILHFGAGGALRSWMMAIHGKH